MTKKYHVKIDGEIGTCSAQDGNCPFSADGAIHTSDIYAAVEVAEKIFESKAQKITSLKKKTNFTNKATSSSNRKVSSSDDEVSTVRASKKTVSKSESGSKGSSVKYVGGRKNMLSRDASQVFGNINELVKDNPTFGEAFDGRRYMYFDAVFEDNIHEANSIVSDAALDAGVDDSGLKLKKTSVPVVNEKTRNVFEALVDASFAGDSETMNLYEDFTYSLYDGVMNGDENRVRNLAKELYSELSYSFKHFDWINDDARDNASEKMSELNSLLNIY